MGYVRTAVYLFAIDPTWSSYLHFHSSQAPAQKRKAHPLTTLSHYVHMRPMVNGYELSPEVHNGFNADSWGPILFREVIAVAGRIRVVLPFWSDHAISLYSKLDYSQLGAESVLEGQEEKYEPTPDCRSKPSLVLMYHPQNVIYRLFCFKRVNRRSLKLICPCPSSET